MSSAETGASRRSALDASIAAVLLSPDRADLLRACLLDADDARAAWSVWRASVGNPKEFFGGDGAPLKGLLALLFAAARRHGLVLEREAATYLNAADLRERMRHATYMRACADVLRRLHDASVDLVVLRGCALGEAVYPEPALRHAMGLTVFLPDEATQRRAVACLAAGGLDRAPTSAERSPPGIERLLHGSGLHVELRTRLFDVAHHAISCADLWRRSTPSTVAGVPARVLAAAPALVEVVGRAWLTRSRVTGVWLCDAYFLARSPALRWDDVVACACEARLARPLSVALEYLARRLQAPVPQAVIAELRAAFADTADRDHVCDLLRSASVRHLSAVDGWRARVWLARRLAFPPREFLRAAYAAPSRLRGQWRHVRRLSSVSPPARQFSNGTAAEHMRSSVDRVQASPKRRG